ncbi:hypothetical protein [Kinneretia aquatilis]|uniref:hypothetical protein n=1 Tax=Kinneretia aquatilis TaxID=2070761 RepID=UPI0014953CC4|nr:hypothetical protein [Paucibacter aquatile]WIV95753.1 hypothetical protein K9V56_011865 [Paucibacter aquatile]
MKLKHFAGLAAGLALLASHSAQALSPQEITQARYYNTLKEIAFSGSSSLRLTLASYIKSICDSSSLHVYFDDALGAKHRAYSCRLALPIGAYAAGTPILVYKRDLGGSLQGVAPIALNDAIDHMRVDNSCIPTATPVFSDIQQPNYTCGNTSRRVSDAGISDLEPHFFNATINLQDNQPGNPESGPSSTVDIRGLEVKPLIQGIFGVAVNLRAYRALQASQGLTQDDSDANRPSVPTTWVRGALTGGLTASNNSRRGWGLLIKPAVDATVHTKTLNICRRQPGSGTQAISNLYFAQIPCDSSSTGALRQASAAAPKHAATGGTYIVNEGASTVFVERCLGSTVEDIEGAYGLGLLSLENNPLALGGDKKYRFVKLDGAQPLRYDPSSERGAITGDYDLVFEATLQYNPANGHLSPDKLAFLDALLTRLPRPWSLAAADPDVQQGTMAPTWTWAPYQHPALPANEQPFASRVARVAGDSCRVLKLAR